MSYNCTEYSSTCTLYADVKPPATQHSSRLTVVLYSEYSEYNVLQSTTLAINRFPLLLFRLHFLSYLNSQRTTGLELHVSSL